MTSQLDILVKCRDEASATIARVQAAGTNLSTALQGANARMAAVGTSLSRIGGNLSRVGSSMTRSVTLPIAAAGFAATKMAVDFDDSMQKIVGLVGVSQDQVSAWSDQILNLSGEVAQSPKDLADALYFVTSAGLRGADAMDALTWSGKAASAGLGDLATIADGVTSALNSYRESGLTAQEATDAMVAAVRSGKMPAEDLAAVLGNVLPVASQMGVSFDQVAAAIASMSRQGMDVARAATGIRYMLMSLMKPTTESVAVFKDYGYSIGEVQSALAENGLLDTLTELAAKMDLASVKGREAFATIVGGARGMSAASVLVGQNAGDVAKVFDDVTNAVGSTNKAFEVASETAGFKFRKALVDLQEAGIGLGNALIPTLTEDVIPAIQGVVKWFDGLSDSSKSLALKLALFTALSGPLLRVSGALLQAGGAVLKLGAALTGSSLAGGLSRIGVSAAGAGAAAGATAGGFASLGAAALAGAPPLLALAAAATIAAGAMGILPSTSDKLVDGVAEASGVTDFWAKTALAATVRARGLAGAMDLLEGSTSELGKGIYGDLHIIDEFGIKLSDAQKFTVEQYLATGNLRGALNLLNQVVKESADPVAKYADNAGRAASETAIWGAKAQFAAQMQKGLSAAAKAGVNPMRSYADATQGLVGQLTAWANAAYQALLNQLKLNQAVSNWHPPGTWSPPGGGKEARPFSRGGIVTRPTLALVGEAGPEAIVPLGGHPTGMMPLGGNPKEIKVVLDQKIVLDRRRFVDALDYELTYRGW